MAQLSEMRWSYPVVLSQFQSTVDKNGGQTEFTRSDSQPFLLGKWGYSSAGRASRSQ